MRRPKVKSDNLIAFLTVTAKHDVDDAVEELGLSASGVRKQLDIIENTFGFCLFEKTGGVLTLEGVAFFELGTYEGKGIIRCHGVNSMGKVLEKT
jgi:hypothetical protein